MPPRTPAHEPQLPRFTAPWPEYRHQEMPFSWRYSQPAGYHHCLDSVEMPWRAARLFQAAPHPLHVLDLCAGCGVLGFEFFFWHRRLARLDFVEKEEGFRPHLSANLALTGFPAENAEITISSYSLLHGQERRYDLVLCNPPYFVPGTGVLPPSGLRRSCRFLEEGSHLSLLEFAARRLAPHGRALVLLRTAPEAPEARALRDGLRDRGFSLFWWGKVRTTWLVVIERREQGSPPAAGI